MQSLGPTRTGGFARWGMQQTEDLAQSGCGPCFLSCSLSGLGAAWAQLGRSGSCDPGGRKRVAQEAGQRVKDIGHRSEDSTREIANFSWGCWEGGPGQKRGRPQHAWRKTGAENWKILQSLMQRFLIPRSVFLAASPQYLQNPDLVAMFKMSTRTCKLWPSSPWPHLATFPPGSFPVSQP